MAILKDLILKIFCTSFGQINAIELQEIEFRAKHIINHLNWRSIAQVMAGYLN